MTASTENFVYQCDGLIWAVVIKFDILMSYHEHKQFSNSIIVTKGELSFPKTGR
jgi:hypothetical protein